jgi:hypothetical protein
MITNLNFDATAFHSETDEKGGDGADAKTSSCACSTYSMSHVANPCIVTLCTGNVGESGAPLHLHRLLILKVFFLSL